MKEQKLYMIRRRKDGLFSTGGVWPTFATNGKMWRSMGSLNGHLSQVYSIQLSRGEDGRKSVLSIEKFADMTHNPYYECDLVEVELKHEIVKDIFTHLALRYTKDESEKGTVGVMET